MAATTIQRHKTAIARAALSRPIQLALSSGVITKTTTVLDYGCGRGDDVRTLASLGFNCTGWDPVHRPDGDKAKSEVVNLGYVVNVIEDPAERADTLKAAWALSKSVLVVSARTDVQSMKEDFDESGDGVLTARGTFQKFYAQPELRDWIDETLSTLSVAGGPGIFFVFRSEEDRARFSSSLFRRRLAAPIGRVSDKLFDEHRDLLAGLVSFFEDRGRIPQPEEINQAKDLADKFGSLPKAFRVVRNATGEERWNQIEDQRQADLQVYLALEKFRKRPRFSDLPIELRYDVKAFWGTYTAACDKADELLFSVGDAALLNGTCAKADVGKLTAEALYVHVSALPTLPPVLRVFEGCARVMMGEVEGANLIKLDRGRPKVSYLSYPDFDESAHPSLAASVVVWLDTMIAKHYDFTRRANPPILHRKETFVAEDYPLREKFARLTRQEEKQDLLSRDTIGTLRGWKELLDEEGFKVAGHTLRRTKKTL